MSKDELPTGQCDEWKVLFDGYVPWPFPTPHGVGVNVASTVSFIRDGDARVVISPGFVPSHRSILDPLEELGVEAGEVTDIVLDHHHPDHVLNAALFPNARVHDVWAIYKGDLWTFRPAQGYEISPAIRLIETPGHTQSCVTTLLGAGEGLVAFTHLWWNSQIPHHDDPVAVDQDAFHRNRSRVLEMSPALIVPGHGPAFAPTPDTPV